MRALVVFLAGVTYGLVASCGAGRVTAYAAVDEACEQAEQEIEDRDDELEETERNLRTVRDACDRVLEAVRTSGGDDGKR